MRVEHAPAKLTLSLRVTGRRQDGYHLLDAEMVTLELADTLLFGPGEGVEVVPLVPSPRFEPTLIARALEAVGQQAFVRLEKRIPVGAGLGGGSADAAAVLRWAGCSDLSVALSLGADVPFCLVGGRARVQGVGELIEPLPVESRRFTLLTPPISVSTAAVYARWDELGGPTGDNGNDLEPAALAVEPRLATWRDQLGNATGRTPRLAGSGSTWFVEGAHPEVPDVVVTRTDRPSGRSV
ncbi:MAG TPA: 4-(cytidine 5'-diphospho)-2-C-methyl-D-erythritol kinase [Acidimicrobiales bacterium]|jgi:4-diphosphocytidyl-2-C-methyl-D-erythritol kinase|nr:4-(cytidine 5'-diphospho)-2-C-methyl-D-erythritol kinase [Acidimicrobiales bacterium]